ncbi:Pr6Pr family membrane protein [Catellatospora sp. NPDC049609]|uniref:Pr6Pr family membrane protein n=1 Tax=Catellatospora sp. NPDC049609 TaxID=3155505 RepID=UPI003430A501
MTKVVASPAFWWRAVLVVVGVLGLLSGTHRLTFYTTQTTVLTLAYFGAGLYWAVRRGTADPAAPRLRGAVTLWIMITALVSHFVNNHGANPLPGLTDADPATALANRSVFVLHYVLPAMVLIDWLGFGPRRTARWRDLPLWLIWPTAYVLLSVFRALAFPEVQNRYPYAFLDPTEGGYGGVVLGVLRLAVGIIALGAALIGLDRLLSRRPAVAALTPDPATPDAATEAPAPATT